MSLIGNERIKLTANWISGLATAFVASGAFAPIAALLYGLASPVTGTAVTAGVMAGCFGLGLALHLVGRIVLGSLRE